MSEAEKYLYDRNYDDILISGDDVMYVSELMEIFHRHQMSKELEEAQKEFDKWFSNPRKERHGFNWLLNYLKSK